jgi:hypothetical protein
MLIIADVFAVAWYRRHCHWPALLKMAPWVAVGMAVGGAALYAIGESVTTKNLMGLSIGLLIFLMLALYLVSKRLGDRYSVHSKVGVAGCGLAAGFSTTVANAAGPVMSIYLAGAELNKEEFIGTGAWYFFIVNLAKLPILACLTFVNPMKPLITVATLGLNVAMLPVIVAGAVVGKTILGHIPQRAFETVVLALAAGGALRLVLG